MLLTIRAGEESSGRAIVGRTKWRCGDGTSRSDGCASNASGGANCRTNRVITAFYAISAGILCKCREGYECRKHNRCAETLHSNHPILLN
jgi:hypothetical protein